MSSEYSSSKSASSRGEWRHTKDQPKAIKHGKKWVLRVAYFRQLHIKKKLKYVKSIDASFSQDFGFYATEKLAKKDATRFREAVDFRTQRNGQGGRSQETDVSIGHTPLRWSQ